MFRALLLSVVLLSSQTSHAAEIPHKVVASNLDNPCGIAIQPETGHVFVSLGGSSKVVRIVEGEVMDVVINFPKDVYGKGPKYDIGPLGLAFLDEKQLVVSGGGLPDGEEIIRIYEVPNLGDAPLDATQMKQAIGFFDPEKPAEENKKSDSDDKESDKDSEDASSEEEPNACGVPQESEASGQDAANEIGEDAGSTDSDDSDKGGSEQTEASSEKDASNQTSKLDDKQEPKPELPEGNFFGIAVRPKSKTLLVTSNGDDTKGWVLRSKQMSKQYQKLERFIATKPLVKVDAPVAITLSSREELLIGQMGEIDESADSLLSFYNLERRDLLLNLKTGLYDITALAYGPIKEKYSSSHLYALDFAWAKPKEGGLFRLEAKLDDAGVQTVKAIRMATLIKPTAMAFGKDGELYVTVFGPDPTEPEKRNGQVLVFETKL